MSQSSNPNASEKVAMNWEMAAHRQSFRSVCTIGEGVGGEWRAFMGATAAGGGAFRGMEWQSGYRRDQKCIDNRWMRDVEVNDTRIGALDRTSLAETGGSIRRISRESAGKHLVRLAYSGCG